MLHKLVSPFILASSLQHLKAGRIDLARRRLDRVLAANPEEFDFILAYDAIVMVQEDRHAEARERLRECLLGLPERMNSDEQYISLFCRFWLGAYDESDELESLRDAARKLEARKTLKRFLHFRTI